MSESEELEYKRAVFQTLSSILGELIPDFLKTPIDQWEQEGRPGPIAKSTLSVALMRTRARAGHDGCFADFHFRVIAACVLLSV